MIVGIDIGGTHTDAVLVHEGKIISSSKAFTTNPLEKGVKAGLAKMIAHHRPQAIHIGTTHATNALLEGKQLFKTGVIRLAGHCPTVLRPCAGWPDYLKERVFAGVETVAGGFECDLRAITPFSAAEVRSAAEKLVSRGAESLALIGVFSRFYQNMKNWRLLSSLTSWVLIFLFLFLLKLEESVLSKEKMPPF